MLGRKTFTKEEIDAGKAAVDRQLSAYRSLAAAVAKTKADAKVVSALEALEPAIFGNLVLALDRFYVHRVRSVTGKDGNPLNELELMVEALMTNGGVLSPSTVFKLVPADSVTKLEFGERVALTADQFDAFSTAFFAELEARCLEG